MPDKNDDAADVTEAMDAIQASLMDLYDQAVMEVDDPREIGVSRDTAKAEAERVASTIVTSARAARILSYEFWRQRNGGAPADWFVAMLATEEEAERVASLIDEEADDEIAEAAKLPRP
jgi:hypothetical protein